jgi:hypothetical protein
VVASIGFGAAAEVGRRREVRMGPPWPIEMNRYGSTRRPPVAPRATEPNASSVRRSRSRNAPSPEGTCTASHRPARLRTSRTRIDLRRFVACLSPSVSGWSRWTSVTATARGVLPRHRNLAPHRSLVRRWTTAGRAG